MNWQDQMYQPLTPGAQPQAQPQYPSYGQPQPQQYPQMPQQQGANNQNIASSLLQFIPSMMAGFKGQNIAPQQQSVGQLGQITNAMTNTTNPLYQQLYGQNRQAMMQDLGQSTAALEGRNRSLSAMGRTPLFSPERGGEMAFRNATQGYTNAGEQAANQTMAQLGNAGGIISKGLLPAQNEITSAKNQNKQYQLGGFANLASALKLLAL